MADQHVIPFSFVASAPTCRGDLLIMNHKAFVTGNYNLEMRFSIYKLLFMRLTLYSLLTASLRLGNSSV